MAVTSRARDAKATLYRSLIIEAAEGLFAANGFEATKIHDIASASGLSLGTLYSVFDGKAAIHDAVHSARLGELFQLGAEAQHGPGPACDRIIAGNRVFIRWMTEHPDFLKIHLNASGAWASTPGKALGEARATAWRQGIDLLAALYQLAIEEGDLHAGDPVLMARIMVAVQQVVLSTWVESGMVTDADSLADRVEAHLRRAFFKNPE